MLDRPAVMLRDSDQDVPAWLWRSAWIAFVGVFGLGITAAVLLAGGGANPPRAGRIILNIGPITGSAVPTNYTTEVGRPNALPDPPYTLEVEVSNSAAWGVAFDDAGKFGIEIDSRGFYSVLPLLRDSTPFIHIRPESNRIAINVEASGRATLRINDEIAWRGTAPTAASATIHITGGREQSGPFTLQRVTVSH